MAHLRKQVLGQLQGSIASIVIKYRNGKPYVASKPGKCNTGKDPVTLFKQSQGRFIGKLSSVIYKIEILKKIWCLTDAPKGYTYQQIWARNYRSIKNNNLSGNVTLVPSCGFKTTNQTIELKENNTGTLTASPLGDKIGLNPAIEKKMIAAGIIILKNRIDGSESGLGYASILSDPIDFDLTSPIVINFNITQYTFPSINFCSIRKSYITLITLDESGSPIHCSEVISGG
jgi:hypothetical protein